jgi:hypothetical protein
MSSDEIVPLPLKFAQKPLALGFDHGPATHVWPPARGFRAAKVGSRIRRK